MTALPRRRTTALTPPDGQWHLQHGASINVEAFRTWAAADDEADALLHHLSDDLWASSDSAQPPGA